MSSPLVFLDTATTGLTLDDDIWEIAAIRRDPDGTETEALWHVEHQPIKCNALPESFRADHAKRFEPSLAISQADAALAVHDLFTNPHSDVKPHVVGAVPNFDTERLARLLSAHGYGVPWHYHLIDVENLVVGYLQGTLHAALTFGELAPNEVQRSLTLPWKSDELASAVGVTITEAERHTAMGDARWAMRIYDAVMGAASGGAA